MNIVELEDVYDDVISEQEESERDKYQWRRLFRTVVYASFIGSFFAFGLAYLLTQWLWDLSNSGHGTVGK